MTTRPLAVRPFASIGIALFSCLFLLASPSLAMKILFEDDFDSGVISPEWDLVKGTFGVTGGVLHGQNTLSDPGRDSVAVTHNGDASWTDYKYSLTVDPQRSTWEQAYLLFRANDVSFATFGFGANVTTYYVSLDVFNIRPQPGLRLFRAVNGTSTLLAETQGFVGSDPMNVVIEGDGARIVVSIDGQTAIDVMDPSPILSGGVGLGAVWEVESLFDNVVVMPEPGIGTLLGIGALMFCGVARGRPRAPAVERASAGEADRSD